MPRITGVVQSSNSLEIGVIDSSGSIAIDTVEDVMRAVVVSSGDDTTETRSPADLDLYGMIRYHLGWTDQNFDPVCADSGKRVRPLISLLTCGAMGGNPDDAVPVAAAIELLHNFTLVHDDIQDRSTQRRGRDTVWRIWGESQAINVGDAIFAISQLALLRSVETRMPRERLARLVAEFNRVALRIVEGQVLDLDFERRWDITTSDYLRMIAGKSAAIVGFASWSGAWVAGADEADCRALADFGVNLGLGFQIRDDYLGVWGSEAETGKVQGDDVRRRKRAIPLVLALDRFPDRDRDWLRQTCDTSSDLDDAAVQRIIALMGEHAIDAAVQGLAEQYHECARELLAEHALPGEYRSDLERLLDGLATRSR
jgi:geranylgeranyl diphosphate synthase, type I